MYDIFNIKAIFGAIFIIISLFVIMQKDRKLADEETKKTWWFKTYIVFMKLAIAFCILVLVEGIIGLNFY